ncbi:hypothetical protein RAA17_18930 [Komagataeibacter rhaeticus]|nr:hypothetical protein [Komagataeibacter rhaeticus]
MGPHGHEGDHARAALAAVSVLLSRGLGMMARIKALETSNEQFTETSLLTRTFLLGVSTRLENDAEIPHIQQDLQDLRGVCRQRIIDALTQEISSGATTETAEVDDLLNCRILHNALDELLERTGTGDPGIRRQPARDPGRPLPFPHRSAS